MSTTTTTTSTLRIALAPLPPPTMNTLGAAERARLVRSTRKLGKVLGATPLLLDSLSPTSPDFSFPGTTKNTHRAARIFHHTPPLPGSSDSEADGYVMVRPGRRAHSRRASVSESTPRASVDSVASFPYPRAQPGSSAQPRLLRIRPAYPVEEPLSPRGAAFTTADSEPLSPTPGMDDRERRRKMAKLARTLGENVPPELVFGPTLLAPQAPTITVSEFAVTQPSIAAPKPLRAPSKRLPARGRIDHIALANFARPTTFADSPSQSRAASPSGSRTATPRTSLDSARAAVDVPAPAPRQRRARPRSLALGASSAIVRAEKAISARAGRSMDIQRDVRAARSMDSQRGVPDVRALKQVDSAPVSARPFVPRAEVPAPATRDTLAPDAAEYGRRKEREWSGEWNVKDMDDVARRLRGLKRR